MAQIKTALVKLPGARKTRECVVYPGFTENGSLRFQGDGICGIVHPYTKYCVYNAKSDRFEPLYMPGTKEYIMDDATLESIKNAQAKSGDTVANGVMRIA